MVLATIDREQLMMMPNRLPSDITPEILTFCRQLDPARAPLWVPVRPTPGAVEAHDLTALKSHIASHGGRVQYGWTLWEHAGWFLEAEFHPLWSSPQGELIEISPERAAAGLTRVLFLPAGTRSFQGEDIPNRFYALSTSPDVVSVVQHAEYLATLRSEGRTQARKALVSQAGGSPGRNDPCPCGSGVKYKKCCGSSGR
jgi:hypothetical protein